MEGYIAEIRLFAATFAPRNWAYCQGQLLSIAQNTALFSLLGTTYGGNGVQNFALPNMASRVAVGAGQGSGLSNYTLGEIDGVETVSLTIQQMPSHTHTAAATVSPYCMNGAPEETSPGGGYMSTATGDLYASTTNATMSSSAATVQVLPNGSNSPHTNLMPYLGMNYIICLYGIFPSRN